MRAVNGELAILQGALNRRPAILVNFISNDGTRAFDCSDRVLEIEHHEYQWTGYARVMLDNRNRDIPDLRGCHVEIEYGDVVNGSPQSVATPRLWVKRQNCCSRPGYLYCTLYLEDAWEDLGELQAIVPGNMGLPDFHAVYDRTITVYDIMAGILSAEGYFAAYTLLELAASDGIIDVFMPYFEVFGGREYRREAIKRLEMMTACYLRMKPELEIEAVYPRDTDPIQVIYYAMQTPYFLEYQGGMSEVIPNTIVVYCNATVDENGNLDWSSAITGLAQDAASVSRIGVKPSVPYLAPLINNLTDANNRAAAILARIKSKTFSGRLLIPHDCRIELYDRIAVGDTR